MIRLEPVREVLMGQLANSHCQDKVELLLAYTDQPLTRENTHLLKYNQSTVLILTQVICTNTLLTIFDPANNHHFPMPNLLVM